MVEIELFWIAWRINITRMKPSSSKSTKIHWKAKFQCPLKMPASELLVMPPFDFLAKLEHQRLLTSFHFIVFAIKNASPLSCNEKYPRDTLKKHFVGWVIFLERNTICITYGQEFFNGWPNLFFTYFFCLIGRVWKRSSKSASCHEWKNTMGLPKTFLKHGKSLSLLLANLRLVPSTILGLSAKDFDSKTGVHSLESKYQLGFP